MTKLAGQSENMAAYHPSRWARECPSRTALLLAGSGAEIGYGELLSEALRTAQLYRGRGLEPGDAVACWLGNHPAFFACYWAAQRAGLYFVPISTRFTPWEARYIIEDSGAKLLIAEAPLLRAAATDPSWRDCAWMALAVGGEVGGLASFEEEVARQPARPVADECEGRTMFYSSGTTGRPKGIEVELSGAPFDAANAVWQIYSDYYDINSNSKCLIPAPLYHAAPLVLNAVVQSRGGTSVVMEKFDAEQALALIERFRITHLGMVPTMFVRMLKLPDEVRGRYDVSSVRKIIHGAAPCPVAVKERMIEWFGPVLVEYYAASEGNIFCCIESREWLDHKGSVGRPVLGPVHILDKQGRELPPGRVGEIWSAGPSSFVYRNDPVQTAASRNALGWTTLGDLGYLDADGFLYLTDRKAFTIISGGVNVYPREVEDVLIDHPDVADAAVFGVPDDDLGERVMAVVQLQQPALSSPGLEADLISFCRRRLSPIKCPRTIEFRAVLPRHDNGKLYKRQLKSEFTAGQGAD